MMRNAYYFLTTNSAFHALLMIAIAVAVCVISINDAENRKRLVFAYADKHHGRVENLPELIGSSSSGPIYRASWRVWLPDGSFISEAQMERENYQ
jgi:hypothetical protein